MSDLPENWLQISLGDIASVTSGIGFPIEYQGLKSGDLPFYKVGDVSRAFLNNRGMLGDAQHYVSNEIAKKLHGKPVAPGSTVFAKIGEALKLNRRAYVQSACLIDNNVMAVKAYKSEFDRYVYYFLMGRDLTEFSRATTVPSLRKGDVETLEFPLPPLNEQKRIAEKLDLLLTRLDSCRSHLERVPQILKRFRQSVLAAATSGRLSEDWREEKGREYDWQKGRFSDIGTIGRGKSKHRPRNDKRLYGGEYPFIQTGDIAQSNGWITSHHQTYSEFGWKQSKLWPENTVCITIAANIANTAILSYPACFPDSVVGFIADPEKSLPQFVKWSIDVIKNDLESFAPATAQKNINLGILEDVQFDYPSLEEQAEIVRRVEKLFAYADRLEARYWSAIERVEQLTPSLLAKAFRGELVEQDPNDEPASVLLERIRALRETNRTEIEKRKRGGNGFE